MEFYLWMGIRWQPWRRVSIPNGMEFYYSRRLRRATIENCFNSQRDGILLWGLLARCVNIPSFNSQRDGILRFVSTVGPDLAQVSIPNGMEFYTYSGRRLRFWPCVSIPNGMEFYSWGYFLQSPRLRFQFPTGWNSILDRKERKRQNRSFNSQRDGIL